VSSGASLVDDIVSDLPERDAAPQAEVLAGCVAVFQRWLHLPDPGPLYVLLAVVAANLVLGDPVWLMLIGPPGSGKTELLDSLSRLPYVHRASVLTEPALLSGTPQKERENGARGGLLRQIGDFGIMLAKDFTSVLSMHRDARSAVFAALREVYDGSWTRHVGTGGGQTLHWSGKVGMIAGCTNALDTHHAAIGAMGERFLLYRLAVDDANAHAERALDHLGSDHRMRDELAEAAASVLAGVNPGAPVPPLSDAERARLRDLAVFAVRVRTAVERDGYHRDVQLLPEHEAPGRLALVLARLHAGLVSIGVPDDETWPLLAKVAWDCVPGVRRSVLVPLRSATEPVTTGAVVSATGLPKTTAERTLEDLTLLGVVRRHRAGQGETSPWTWQLTDWARNLWPNPASPEVSGGSLTSPSHSFDDISGEA
jgi:hypothetical protein